MILHFAFVLLDVRERAEQALLLASEKNEANGAARVRPGFHDGVGSSKNTAGAEAVVGGALAEIPGIEMRADDEDLFGMFAAGNFTDDVCALDRAVGEGVLHVDAHAHGLTGVEITL